MNVITITREYGGGGGEVARKLAESLGWELLDREQPPWPPEQDQPNQ